MRNVGASKRCVHPPPVPGRVLMRCMIVEEWAEFTWLCVHYASIEYQCNWPVGRASLGGRLVLVNIDLLVA